ncbi:MAG: hypothetical protein HFF39_08305 [Lawsonibacter sp.]|nr:hypothetical protein [Lawsonibacter sp.]
MKRTLIALSLTAALLCTLGGWACAAGEKDLRPSAQAEGYIPGDVPAESTAMDAMVPPINALVLCMLEQDLVYNESSDVFLWNSLYYMISLYGQMDTRAELTDDTLILPSETVRDYAAALFTNYAGLPALPAHLRDRVSYDADQDCYRLARGDAGLSETRVDRADKLPGGLLQVSGALIALEDEGELCRFQAILSANNSMFGYSVSGLEIL